MPEPSGDLSVTGDVIESSPPPRRPVLTRVAVIGAAVLAVAALLALREARGRTPFDPMPMVTGPTPSLVMPLPDHIATDALGPGIDLGTFVVPTNPPMLVDTTAGIRRTIPALSGGVDPFFDVTDLGDGRFLIVAWRHTADGAEAFLVQGAMATRIASGDAIVAGADGASVLVTHENGTAGRTVQRYDFAGRASGGPVAFGPNEYVEADTVAGWVIIDYSTNRWQVRDPATGLVRYQIDEPLAVGPRALAYVLADGRLAVDTLPGGSAAPATVTYPYLPKTGPVYQARFSPNGRYLAVDLIGANPIDHTLLVLDRTTGGWSVLPGTPVRPRNGRAPRLAWGGDVLAVAIGEGAVALWHPGDATVYAAPAP